MFVLKMTLTLLIWLWLWSKSATSDFYLASQKTDDFNWKTTKIGSSVSMCYNPKSRLWDLAIDLDHMTLTLIFFITPYLNSKSHTTCNIIRNGFLVTKIDFVLNIYARRDLDLGIEHVTLMSKYPNYLK